MPVISAFYGIVITMLFDDHNPPHFHVKYGEYRAVITIGDGIVTGSLPRRALNLVYEWLDMHRDELMANWRRMENREALKDIEPLN
ncbi:MAG: DUF4160 domain-containing protein [Alistipes sp.]|jgi:hypothetical protein|nr:DUF4160 domain-containing protein [Alistipes sp.]